MAVQRRSADAPGGMYKKRMQQLQGQHHSTTTSRQQLLQSPKGPPGSACKQTRCSGQPGARADKGAPSTSCIASTGGVPQTSCCHAKTTITKQPDATHSMGLLPHTPMHPVGRGAAPAEAGAAACPHNCALTQTVHTHWHAMLLLQTPYTHADNGRVQRGPSPLLLLVSWVSTTTHTGAHTRPIHLRCSGQACCLGAPPQLCLPCSAPVSIAVAAGSTVQPL